MNIVVFRSGHRENVHWSIAEKREKKKKKKKVEEKMTLIVVAVE